MGLTTGTIYHIGVTWGGKTTSDTITVYVDGVSVASGSPTNNWSIGSTYPALIGASTNSSWEPFVGIISDVAIYPSVVNSTDMLNHYNKGTLA